MSYTNSINCFVSLSGLSVIDSCRPDGTSWIYGQTLEQLQVRYPDAQVMTLERAASELERLRLARSSGPMEITQEQFIDALECLPPAEWHHHTDTESFKSSEAFSGRITSAYVRLNNRYFTFHALFGTSHKDLVSACRNSKELKAEQGNLAN